MYSLLDSCHKELDLATLLDNVENSYEDDYDVKLLAYLILLRVIHQSPASLSTRVVKFCEHSKKILNLRVKVHFSVSASMLIEKKLQQDAVKQEAERSEELKRAVVRVVARISNNSAEILADSNR